MDLNAPALYQWLKRQLGKMGFVSDAEMLAKYIIAIIQHDTKLDKQLRLKVVEKLKIFMQNETTTFVDTLFEVIKSKSYNTDDADGTDVMYDDVDAAGPGSTTGSTFTNTSSSTTGTGTNMKNIDDGTSEATSSTLNPISSFVSESSVINIDAVSATPSPQPLQPPSSQLVQAQSSTTLSEFNHHLPTSSSSSTSSLSTSMNVVPPHTKADSRKHTKVSSTVTAISTTSSSLASHLTNFGGDALEEYQPTSSSSGISDATLSAYKPSAIGRKKASTSSRSQSPSSLLPSSQTSSSTYLASNIDEHQQHSHTGDHHQQNSSRIDVYDPVNPSYDGGSSTSEGGFGHLTRQDLLREATSSTSSSVTKHTPMASSASDVMFDTGNDHHVSGTSGGGSYSSRQRNNSNVKSSSSSTSGHHVSSSSRMQNSFSTTTTGTTSSRSNRYRSRSRSPNNRRGVTSSSNNGKGGGGGSGKSGDERSTSHRSSRRDRRSRRRRHRSSSSNTSSSSRSSYSSDYSSSDSNSGSNSDNLDHYRSRSGRHGGGNSSKSRNSSIAATLGGGGNSSSTVSNLTNTEHRPIRSCVVAVPSSNDEAFGSRSGHYKHSIDARTTSHRGYRDYHHRDHRDGGRSRGPSSSHHRSGPLGGLSSSSSRHSDHGHQRIPRGHNPQPAQNSWSHQQQQHSSSHSVNHFNDQDYRHRNQGNHGDKTHAESAQQHHQQELISTEPEEYVPTPLKPPTSEQAPPPPYKPQTSDGGSSYRPNQNRYLLMPPSTTTTTTTTGVPLVPIQVVEPYNPERPGPSDGSPLHAYVPSLRSANFNTDRNSALGDGATTATFTNNGNKDDTTEQLVGGDVSTDNIGGHTSYQQSQGCPGGGGPPRLVPLPAPPQLAAFQNAGTLGNRRNNNLYRGTRNVRGMQFIPRLPFITPHHPRGGHPHHHSQPPPQLSLLPPDMLLTPPPPPHLMGHSGVVASASVVASGTGNSGLGGGLQPGRMGGPHAQRSSNLIDVLHQHSNQKQHHHNQQHSSVSSSDGGSNNNNSNGAINDGSADDKMIQNDENIKLSTGESNDGSNATNVVGGKMGTSSTSTTTTVTQDKDRTTIVLRRIPPRLNKVGGLAQHFSKYGTVVHIQVAYDNDPEAALVQFSNLFEASAAIRSTEAVFNNRFIRVYWLNQEHKQQQGVNGGKSGKFIRGRGRGAGVAVAQQGNNSNNSNNNNATMNNNSSIISISNVSPKSMRTVIMNNNSSGAVDTSSSLLPNSITQLSSTQQKSNAQSLAAPITAPTTSGTPVISRTERAMKMKDLANKYKELQESVLNQKLLMRKLEAATTEKEKEMVKKLLRQSLRNIKDLEASIKELQSVVKYNMRTSKVNQPMTMLTLVSGGNTTATHTATASSHGAYSLRRRNSNTSITSNSSTASSSAAGRSGHDLKRRISSLSSCGIINITNDSSKQTIAMIKATNDSGDVYSSNKNTVLAATSTFDDDNFGVKKRVRLNSDDVVDDQVVETIDQQQQKKNEEKIDDVNDDDQVNEDNKEDNNLANVAVGEEEELDYGVIDFDE